MQYDIKIGVGAMFGRQYARANAFHSRGAKSSVFEQQQHEAFWGDTPHAKQPHSPRKPSQPKNDWSEAHMPYTQGQNYQQQRDNEETLRNQRHERRKRRLLDELTGKLADALSTIVHLDAEIEALKVEREAADVTVEQSRTYDDETAFWKSIFERNIKINHLSKQREGTLGEYRRFYRTLRQLDPKQAQEAKEIYDELRKTTEKGEGKRTNQPKAHDHVPETVKEELTRSGDSNDQDSVHGSYEKEEDHTFIPPSPSKAIKRSSAKVQDWLDNKVDLVDPDSDEEVLLYPTRLIHKSHREVQSEFWTIMDGNHMCSYCGDICPVMQCPRWEQCGLLACGNCKNSY